MGFLEQFHVVDALHAVSQVLLIPTVVLLLLLMAYCVYTIGSIVVEAATERRLYRVALPALIASLDEARYESMDDVISRSGLLDSQRRALHSLVSYMYLPDDALTEVAKRLLADESNRYQKALSWTDSAVKIGPMLGLMGTLIPLGPGLVALGGGDLDTLSTALITAFDTTVAGLVVAIVCYLVTKTRRRWYNDYLVSLEGAMNAILEKAHMMHEQGFDFDAARSSVSYTATASAATSTLGAVPIAPSAHDAVPASVAMPADQGSEQKEANSDGQA